MIFYIPTLGYVSGAFTLNGRQYPSKWLSLATTEDLEDIGAVPGPTPEPGQLVERTPTGWLVRDKTPEELAGEQAAADAIAAAALKKELDRCWARYDGIVAASVDLNARSQYLFWLMEPTTSELKRQRINEVIAWTQTVWTTYYQDKSLVAAGTLVAYAELPVCPWQFVEIAFTP